MLLKRAPPVVEDLTPFLIEKHSEAGLAKS